MTRSQLLQRLNEMRIELDLYRSMLTPPRKRKPRQASNYDKEIIEYVNKIKLK